MSSFFDDDRPNPSDNPQPGSDATPGSPPSPGVPTPAGMNSSILDLLERLDTLKARPDTREVIVAYAQSVSGEVLEAMLDLLAELLPLWKELVRRKRTRTMPLMIDEYVWFTKATLGLAHETPAAVADHLGILAVLNFGAELAKRVR